MDLLLGLATSLHLGLAGDYNGLHPHIGIEHNNIIGGVYYNSESALSTYMGYEFVFDEFNLEGGVVTGYSTGATPFVRATRDLDENRKAFIAPVIEEDATGNVRTGIVLGLEFNLK